MKKTLIPVSISILLFCAAAVVSAQPPIPIPTPVSPQPTPVLTVSNAPDLPRRNTEISDRDNLEERQWERTFIPRAPFDISKEARAKVKISKDERASYEKIADANNLEMLKVFSAPQCAENPLVIDASDEKCAAAADLLRVSFYSFFFDYYGETIGDFRILEDTLIAGNDKYIHGFMIDLGETDVAKIGKETAEVELLKNYPVAKTIKEESRQRADLQKGFDYQNLRISSRQKLRANHIYLMRIVSYSSKNDRARYYDKDSVYVLKVAGLNADNMAVILWRKIYRTNAPRLKDEN